MKIQRLEETTGPLEYGELTPEQLVEAYKLAREAFTAADLQKYTEFYDDDVSFEDVVCQMEENQKRFDAKRKPS